MFLFDFVIAYAYVVNELIFKNYYYYVPFWFKGQVLTL